MGDEIIWNIMQSLLLKLPILQVEKTACYTINNSYKLFQQAIRSCWQILLLQSAKLLKKLIGRPYKATFKTCHHVMQSRQAKLLTKFIVTRYKVADKTNKYNMPN